MLEFGHIACAQVQGRVIFLGHKNGHRVPVYTPFLLVLGKSTALSRSSHFPQAQKWAPGPCVHTSFVGSGEVNCFVLTAKLMFQNGI